jgi:sugar lactone lactonase YvrE
MSHRLLPRLALATALAGMTAIAAQAAPPASIHVPGRLLMPESITSAGDGSVYFGSVVEGAVYRAAPGSSEAEQWIAPHTAGLAGVFGVLADDASGTLWACSGSLTMPGSTAKPAPSALHAFDLATGEPKGQYVFPTAGASCNDIAVAEDGTTYATDTANLEVVRLAPGGDALSVWSPEGAFGPKGGVLDGIAIVDGRVLVNTLATSKLFAVAVSQDGSAGAATELTLDRPLERPDGMRAFGGNGLLIAEGGAGRLSRIVLDGDQGHVTTISQGFADGPVAVTVVNGMAYVLEGQFKSMRAGPDAELPPIHAVGVPVGK